MEAGPDAQRQEAKLDAGADYRLFRLVRACLFLVIAIAPLAMILSGREPADDAMLLSLLGGLGLMLERFMSKLRRARRLP